MTYTQTYDQGSLFMNYMKAKTFLESHRDDRVPPFALAPHSTGHIKEQIQTRAIVVILDPKTLVIIAGPYEQLTPINCADPSGHMALWAIGLVAGVIIGVVIGGTYGGLTAVSQGATGWEVVGAIWIGALAGGIMGAGAGFGSAVLTGALAEVAGIAAFSGASWCIALGASAGTGVLGGFAMDTLSQTMYNGRVTDWASVGVSSLQAGIVNVVSMLSTSIGGGAGASWAANLGMNFVMGFPVSSASFTIDMFRYYVWNHEEEKERRRRHKVALAWSW